MTPISAAGVPPRKTIARTMARKLPEIFSCDSVSIDITSLKAEKPSRIEKRAMSQFASGACQTAAAIATTKRDRQDRRAEPCGPLVFHGRVRAGRRRSGLALEFPAGKRDSCDWLAKLRQAGLASQGRRSATPAASGLDHLARPCNRRDERMDLAQKPRKAP